MRDLFQPKAGGSLPVSCGLHVAAGKQRGKVLAKVREKVLESTGRTATINL